MKDTSLLKITNTPEIDTRNSIYLVVPVSKYNDLSRDLLHSHFFLTRVVKKTHTVLMFTKECFRTFTLARESEREDVCINHCE